MTEVLDVSDWVPADDPEWMGTRWKVWLQDPEVEEMLWLFKAVRCKDLPDGTRRCFEEDWAEWLATQLAGRLGVPAAPTRLARWSQMNGIISRSLLQDERGAVVADTLEHGNELLQAADPTYDKDQHGQARGYTLDAVWAALQGIGIQAVSRSPLTTAQDVFAGILVLDALIANTDRHHENWGALVRGSKRWLAPTFDQGTCLGFQGPDDMRLQYLERTSGHGMEVWVRRGHSNHFEGGPGLVELAAAALQRVPEAVARHWGEQVAALGLDWWWDTIAAVPEDRMSHAPVDLPSRSCASIVKGCSMSTGIVDRTGIRVRTDERTRRLLVIWQHPETRRFIRVGHLDVEPEGQYVFEYEPEAAHVAGFEGFAAFPDLRHRYRSDELFPFFTNRVMSPRRPEYETYLDALGIEDDEQAPVELLARTGGTRATDTVHIVPEPRVEGDGTHVMLFLASGTRYLDPEAEHLSRLSAGDELALREDSDNPVNPDALLLDTSSGQPVGWVPDYLLDLVHDYEQQGSVRVCVERVSGPEAPPHLRLLCRLEAWLAE